MKLRHLTESRQEVIYFYPAILETNHPLNEDSEYVICTFLVTTDKNRAEMYVDEDYKSMSVQLPVNATPLLTLPTDKILTIGKSRGIPVLIETLAHLLIKKLMKEPRVEVLIYLEWYREHGGPAFEYRFNRREKVITNIDVHRYESDDDITYTMNREFAKEILRNVFK